MANLNENDLSVLRVMAQDWKSTRSGTIPSANEHLSQASDVYIALVPPGGIPPLQEIIGEADRPGYATCDIYRIRHELGGTGTADDEEPTLRPIDGQSRRVYNISADWVDSRWAIVVKTKGGKWLAIDMGSAARTGTGTGTTGTATAGTGTTGTAGTATAETGTATAETGTAGTGSPLCLQIPGLAGGDIPVVEPGPGATVLGYDENGCLVRFPLKLCQAATGTGS